MHCCIADLRCKDVICRADGRRLGHICDAEVDTCTGQVTAFIVYGRLRWFGLFGHAEDLRIRWEDIEVIGDDAVLVSRIPRSPPRPRY